MNERIRELAEQANNAIGGNAFSMARYNEKFAELIIRECSNVAYQTYQTNSDNIEGIHIANAIINHFGV